MGILDKVVSLVSRQAPARAETARAGTPRSEELATLEDGLDRWLTRLLHTTGDSATGGLLPATVRETDGELVISTEIPGFRRDEVEVVTTGSALVIRGEKREQRADGAAEIRYGRFTYRLPLPPGVEAERARAQLDDAILTVRIPKSDRRSARRRIKLTA